MGNFGKFERSLDDSARVVLPPTFKSDFSTRFFLVLWFGNIIQMWTEAEFIRFTSELDGSDAFDMEKLNFKRAFYGRIAEVSLDRVSRFKIPEFMMQEASITKEIVFVGMGNKVEIWPKEGQANFREQITNDVFKEMASNLFKRKNNGAE